MTGLSLYHIKEYAHELQNGACEDEEVEHRVEPAAAPSESVYHRSDGVGDASREEVRDTGQPYRFNGDLRGEDDAPAHDDIRDHGENTILFQVDRGHGRGEGGERPDDAEDGPAPGGGGAADGAEEDGRIGPRYQKIYRAMVYHLKDFFGKARAQAVVYRRRGIEKDQRDAVYRASDYRPGVAVKGGEDDAQNERGDAEGASDDVARHIEYLLPLRVRGEFSLFKRCS